VYRKKPEFGRFFHVFSTRNFFSKMTVLGLVLCEESIARIPKLENASLILIQGNVCFVLKRNRKILGFLPQNHLPGDNFMRGIDCAQNASLTLIQGN
jgi:hypothetical protein